MKSKNSKTSGGKMKNSNKKRKKFFIKNKTLRKAYKLIKRGVQRILSMLIALSTVGDEEKKPETGEKEFQVTKKSTKILIILRRYSDVLAIMIVILLALLIPLEIGEFVKLICMK